MLSRWLCRYILKLVDEFLFCVGSVDTLEGLLFIRMGSFSEISCLYLNYKALILRCSSLFSKSRAFVLWIRGKLLRKADDIYDFRIWVIARVRQHVLQARPCIFWAVAPNENAFGFLPLFFEESSPNFHNLAFQYLYFDSYLQSSALT